MCKYNWTKRVSVRERERGRLKPLVNTNSVPPQKTLRSLVTAVWPAWHSAPSPVTMLLLLIGYSWWTHTYFSLLLIAAVTEKAVVNFDRWTSAVHLFIHMSVGIVNFSPKVYIFTVVWFSINSKSQCYVIRCMTAVLLQCYQRCYVTPFQKLFLVFHQVELSCTNRWLGNIKCLWRTKYVDSLWQNSLS